MTTRTIAEPRQRPDSDTLGITSYLMPCDGDSGTLQWGKLAIQKWDFEMVRAILWLLIAAMLAWLVWQRLRKGSVMTTIGFIGGLALAVYLTLAILLFVFQHKLLYIPWRQVESTPADIGLDFEDVRIATPDGEHLAAWYLPAQNAEWTILFCHGNAGNIGHRLDTLAIFHELGLNCLIFDYRGYGQSTGRPTEEGTLVDALAAYRWLTEDQQIPSESILWFGRSLGGAVAAQAVARLTEKPPAALVIESAFTSFVDIGSHYYPWLPVRWFARYAYNTKDAVQTVACPVVVIHSPDDEMIPFDMGRRIYEAGHDPKRFFELKGAHNEGFFENLALYQSIWAEIIDFLTTQHK